MRGPGWIGENGGSEEEEIASREARRTGGGCAGAGGRTRELVVQPRSDGVEAYVSHSAPREAVFSIPGHTARVRHAPSVRRLERRRAPVRDGRLRRLVQPPPPQHLIRLGETLEEALDDDVPGRRHHRHAKHAARHGASNGVPVGRLDDAVADDLVQGEADHAVVLKDPSLVEMFLRHRADRIHHRLEYLRDCAGERGGGNGG